MNPDLAGVLRRGVSPNQAQTLAMAYIPTPSPLGAHCLAPLADPPDRLASWCDAELHHEPLFGTHHDTGRVVIDPIHDASSLGQKKPPLSVEPSAA